MINRGYVTHYTKKLTLGIRTILIVSMHNMMIIVQYYDKIYLQLSMNYTGSLEL